MLSSGHSADPHFFIVSESLTHRAVDIHKLHWKKQFILFTNFEPPKSRNEQASVMSPPDYICEESPAFLSAVLILQLSPDQIYRKSIQQLTLAVAMQNSNLEELRCIICKALFVPPHNLPHLLPCTHYICTRCLQLAKESTLICPEDLEINSIKDIRSNCMARKALHRLVKEHTVFNQNNQLFCIQSLSKHFESALDSRSKEKSDFKDLLEKIIHNQINRLKNIQQSILEEMESPFQMVKDWKEMVKEYLSQVKSMDRASRKDEITNQLSYFVEQGRRIKSDLSKFQRLDFNEVSNIIAVNPSICLRNEFSLQKYIDMQNTSRDPRLSDLEEDNRSQRDGKQQNLLQKSKEASSKRSNESFFEEERHSCLNSIELDKDSSQKQNSLRIQDHRQVQYSRVAFDKEQCSSKNGHSLKDSKSYLVPLSQNAQFDPNRRSRQFTVDTKQLLYSLSPSRNDPTLNEMNSDQRLLTENEDKRDQPSHRNRDPNEKYDFLQRWQLSQHLPSESITVQRRRPFDWEKQKNCYIRKLQVSKVEEALSETNYHQNCIQLINFSVSDIDLGLFLKHWQGQGLEVIKFVKTGLTDQQFNELLNFALNAKVTTLVLSGNSLGEISLDALLNFTKVGGSLRNVYLSKNQINPLRGYARQKISLLRQKGINLYI